MGKKPQKGVAAHARHSLVGALTGGKGVTDTTAAVDLMPLRHRQDAATLLISLEDDTMHVTAGWTVGVATLLLILGTPQASRPEATISFSSRYYYFCWNPSAQGHACSQRSSKKIWTSSPVPVEIELRAACKQSHYGNVMYATEESKVREAFEAECWQGAKHQRLRRDAQQERVRQDVSK